MKRPVRTTFYQSERDLFFTWSGWRYGERHSPGSFRILSGKRSLDGDGLDRLVGAESVERLLFD